MIKIDPTIIIKRWGYEGFSLYLIYEEVQNAFNIILRNNDSEKVWVFSDPDDAAPVFSFLTSLNTFVLGVIIQE